MKEEMIKFLEKNQLPLYLEERKLIKSFIETFFDYYQPERSKREDSIKECEELGHMNTWMPKNQVLCMRCGALNTEVTQ